MQVSLYWYLVLGLGTDQTSILGMASHEFGVIQLPMRSCRALSLFIIVFSFPYMTHTEELWPWISVAERRRYGVRIQCDYSR